MQRIPVESSNESDIESSFVASRVTLNLLYYNWPLHHPIWTNNVTDGGAALETAVSKACALLQVSNWKAYSSTSTYTDDNGVKWAANNEFAFSLGLARATQELECVNTGIKNGSGNPNNPTCPLHALLDPPGIANLSTSGVANGNTSSVA